MKFGRNWGRLGMKSKLSDICSYRKEKIAVAELDRGNYISTENMLPDKNGVTTATSLPTTIQTQKYAKGDILVSNIRPYFKKIWFADKNGGCSNDVLVFKTKEGTDPRYLYYVLANDPFFEYSMATAKGTKMPRGDKKALMEYEVPDYDLKEQNKIAGVLSAIDDKIQLNNKINKNLLKQAQAIYREMFVNATNDQRQTCRAEEYFDIAIGKTPPRKEHQWFTTNPSDVTWVSISDMGGCGTYIRRSSEQLTQEAVDKFNIRIIPSNTVLLSFKLTVGRIAITYGEMTTNEAIAHFKTDKTFINEYLYCYLKDFNYQTMGSTSSIATAVNSKIIKAMPFVIPTDDEIFRFHTVVGPMFEQILNNQLENDLLAEMRDALLPRLMSGELDVSNLDL